MIDWLPSVECRMEVDGCCFTVQDACHQLSDHEGFVGHFEFADEAEARRRLEAEARVVRWMTNDKDRVDPQTLAFLEACSYQRGPDADTLARGMHRHWRERHRPNIRGAYQLNR